MLEEFKFHNVNVRPPSTSSSSSTCRHWSTMTRPCLLGSRVLAEPPEPLASYPNPAYRSSTRA